MGVDADGGSGEARLSAGLATGPGSASMNEKLASTTGLVMDGPARTDEERGAATSAEAHVAATGTYVLPSRVVKMGAWFGVRTLCRAYTVA